MKILPASPKDPRATRLLNASHALMQTLFPPEENFALDVDALCAPSVRFLVAEEGGVYLGCVALKICAGYGEVKSLFVDAEARGRGVADHLMDAVETTARQDRLPLLRLETGAVLEAAMRLYARRGFVETDHFGDYEANPSSVFMEKPLT